MTNKNHKIISKILTVHPLENVGKLGRRKCVCVCVCIEL